MDDETVEVRDDMMHDGCMLRWSVGRLVVVVGARARGSVLDNTGELCSGGEV
jgi:hypothetical protein